MDNRNERTGGDGDRQGLRGSDLQQSQEGGQASQQSGDFHQGQPQAAQGGVGGRQMGGGASRSDMGQGGGSSGSGGYGNMQNQQNQQGQQQERRTSPGQSRGEAYDERQGGGRGPESVSDWDQQQGTADPARQLGSTGGGGMDPTQGGRHAGASEWDQQQGTNGDDRQQGGGESERDRRRHQDRGQGDIESSSER